MALWEYRPALWTDKHLWKHYLPPTSCVGGNKCKWAPITVFISYWCEFFLNQFINVQPDARFRELPFDKILNVLYLIYIVQCTNKNCHSQSRLLSKQSVQTLFQQSLLAIPINCVFSVGISCPKDFMGFVNRDLTMKGNYWFAQLIHVENTNYAPFIVSGL